MLFILDGRSVPRPSGSVSLALSMPSSRICLRCDIATADLAKIREDYSAVTKKVYPLQ